MRVFIFVLFVLIFTNSSAAQKTDRGLANILDDADIDGVMLFYDQNSKKMKTSSKGLCRRHTLPGSTFKIFNSLFLLQLGIIHGPDHVLKWDGVERSYRGKPVEVWNKDTNFRDAFRNSTVWYFEEMSRDIPLKIYRKAVKDCKYGEIASFDCSNLDFWNSGSRFRIDPKDQLSLLRRLSMNELSFDVKHQETVKELMIESQTDSFVLRGKTGLSENYSQSIWGKRWYGWYIGYIETEDNKYYFVTRLIDRESKKREGFLKLRKTVTYKGLKYLYNIDIETKTKK